MKLYKEGITIEIFSPIEITRFKRLGYEEIKEEKPVEEKPVKAAKTAKTVKK